MIESIMKFNSMVCHEKLNDSAAKHATTKSNEKMKSIYVDYLNVSMMFFLLSLPNDKTKWKWMAMHRLIEIERAWNETISIFIASSNSFDIELLSIRWDIVSPSTTMTIWVNREENVSNVQIKSLKLIEGETSFSVFINCRLYISRNSISLRIIQIDWILNSRIDLFFSAIFLAN